MKSNQVFFKKWQVVDYHFCIRNQCFERKPEEWERQTYSFTERAYERDCSLEIQECVFEWHKCHGKYRVLWNDCDDEYFEKFTNDIGEAHEIANFMTSLNEWKDVRDCFNIFGFKHW